MQRTEAPDSPLVAVFLAFSGCGEEGWLVGTWGLPTWRCRLATDRTEEKPRLSGAF
jgi:hypothetical protein